MTKKILCNTKSFFVKKKKQFLPMLKLETLVINAAGNQERPVMVWLTLSLIQVKVLFYFYHGKQSKMHMTLVNGKNNLKCVFEDIYLFMIRHTFQTMQFISKLHLLT